MIGVTITGEEMLVDRLASFPERLRRRLVATMERLGDDLAERVSAKLSGEVLTRQSGRLSAGVAAVVDEGADALSLRLGISGDVPYAAYQEFGFRGQEAVRAYLRRVKQAFGRAIAEREVVVKSHTRRVDYPAHSFVRAALAEIDPEISASVEGAAAATAGEA
jgi:hypothetical protein